MEYSNFVMYFDRRIFMSLTAATLVAGLSLHAQAKGKLLLIMFDQAGCPWCAKWQKEVGVVYDKTFEGKRAPLRRLNMFGDLPPELAFIKKIIYSPTFVLTDGNKELGRIVGYPGEAHFYVQLSQLLDKYDRAQAGS